jgi:hypothetical protein
VARSAGFNGTVTVTPFQGTNIGLWVQQDNNGAGHEGQDTRLIDVTTTCNTGYIQHVYAGCGEDGCLVREGLNPATEQYWDFIDYMY